jgi:hypothetical protein
VAASEAVLTEYLLPASGLVTMPLGTVVGGVWGDKDSTWLVAAVPSDPAKPVVREFRVLTAGAALRPGYRYLGTAFPALPRHVFEVLNR